MNDLETSEHILIDTQREYYDIQSRLGKVNFYFKWIFLQFHDMIRPGRILDMGCGNGHLLPYLAQYGTVLGVDLSLSSVEHIRKVYTEWPKITARQFNVVTDDYRELGLESFDTIISADVAEHIENDTDFFRKAASLLAPGGRLMIKVPAHPLLYGSIDVHSSHFRRYSRAMLRARLEQAGLRVEVVRHMNALGVLPYFVNCKIRKKKSCFSASLSSWSLGLGNIVTPLWASLERVVTFPFGLSLIAIAQKER